MISLNQFSHKQTIVNNILAIRLVTDRMLLVNLDYWFDVEAEHWIMFLLI